MFILILISFTSEVVGYSIKRFLKVQILHVNWISVINLLGPIFQAHQYLTNT